MCGISGLAATRPSVLSSMREMWSERLKHRGPDDVGVWNSPCRRVKLGHRRLAILDLTTAGHQPMLTADGNSAIVFNGEIYNFASVQRELEAKGYSFVSRSDTEVLLYAYQEWGPECVQRLNGMFAFAIFEQDPVDGRCSIFIARDRAGEKPFYYKHNESRGTFEFASELKALDHSGAIDLHALNFYLSLGYVPANLCLFQGVAKLPPGHCGRFELDTGKFKTWQYWSLPANSPDKRVDGPELAQHAGDLLKDSVRLRLVADVPVGVLLSGGLDSSLVTAAAAQVSSSPIETFTISLPGSSLDEAHHAHKVASHFGTKHHVLPLERPSLDHLNQMAALIDEPIADSSIIPAWLVFGLARERVTVALGGDGGDELFGGYTDYTTSMADEKRLGRFPMAFLGAIGGAAAQLPAGVRGRNRLASLRRGPLRQMIWGRPYFDVALRQRILAKDALATIGSQLEAPEGFLTALYDQGQDPIDRMTRTHFGSILPDDFLVKVDRASMMHSLEVRAPFLDHRLIEFAFACVPSAWKVQGGESRRLQRILSKQWLPSDLDVNRKQGFSIPINEWIRAEGESRLMERMDGLPEEINMNEVHALIKGHMNGRANGGRLFGLVMLAIAMRNLRSSS